MPYGGSANAPNFDGKEATEFINWFDILCYDHDISRDEIFCRLPTYCTAEVREIVEDMIEF